MDEKDCPALIVAPKFSELKWVAVVHIFVHNASKSMKPGRIKRIGLTGGIASGKSTVSEMLAQLGASIVDTDKIAREVVQPGSEAMAAICRRFGAELANPDGSLRRELLAEIVFSDPQAREWLQDLLHPKIRARAEELSWQAGQSGHPIVVFDVPLLFESGWDQYVDAIWTVYVSPEIQRVRLARRDGLTMQEIEMRLEAQWPIGRKARYSDVVINNEGDLADTLRQVRKAWHDIMQTV